MVSSRSAQANLIRPYLKNKIMINKGWKHGSSDRFVAWTWIQSSEPQKSAVIHFIVFSSQNWAPLLSFLSWNMLMEASSYSVKLQDGFRNP
jgi:hypothetical protein